jgi:ABC-type transporter Mla subunit MlaD
VTLSSLQKRILDLSSKILSADDSAEFNRIASELKSALREHNQALRAMVEETKKRLVSESNERPPGKKKGRGLGNGR